MMGDRDKSDNPGRRGFLQATLMTVLAAGATGLAGWVMLRGDEPEVTVVTMAETVVSAATPTPQPTAQPTLVTLTADLEREKVQLATELARVKADADVLRADLVARDGVVEELQRQLATARSQIGALDGLTQLYAQLDALAVDAMLETGLSHVFALVEGMIAQLPFFRTGLDVAAGVLDQLEQSLPSIQDGLSWILELIDGLADRLQEMEDALTETVAPLQPLAQALAAFATKILRWIPFGVGRQVALGLDGMAKVLTQLPELVRGVAPFLLVPLGRWFDMDGDNVAMNNVLVAPIRDDVLAPAGQLADDMEQFRGRLEGITSPLLSTVADRQRIREQIVDYRQQHEL